MLAFIDKFIRYVSLRVAEHIKTSLEPELRRTQVVAQGAAIERELAGLRAKIDLIQREIEFTRYHRSNYLGDGISIVWLPDDTIMYVNSNDEGSPTALISGGRFEEEYFTVFRSFLTESSHILDVGANIGMYSLRAAQHFRNTNGKVIAFEPHPMVSDLLRRSVNHNGLQDKIEVRQGGLADVADEAVLYYPVSHLGGGGYRTPNDGAARVAARREVADEIFPDEVFDLVKITTEGDDAKVLLGMRQLIARSPKIAILFKKLVGEGEPETETFSWLSSFGLQIYAIEHGSRLRRLDSESYHAAGGYLLAARPAVVGQALDRDFFDIGWRQLHFAGGNPTSQAAFGVASGSAGQLLFHGPYWFLAKGRHRLTILGEIEGSVEMTITEHFGVEVVKFVMDAATPSVDFDAPRDLHKFECVLRAQGAGAKLVLERLRISRV